MLYNGSPGNGRHGTEGRSIAAVQLGLVRIAATTILDTPQNHSKYSTRNRRRNLCLLDILGGWLLPEKTLSGPLVDLFDV